MHKVQILTLADLIDISVSTIIDRDLMSFLKIYLGKYVWYYDGQA